MKETHGGVEGGTTPALQAVKHVTMLRNSVGHFELVVAAHAGGEQGLVRVAHRGIRNKKALL